MVTDDPLAIEVQAPAHKRTSCPCTTHSIALIVKASYYVNPCSAHVFNQTVAHKTANYVYSLFKVELFVDLHRFDKDKAVLGLL